MKYTKEKNLIKILDKSDFNISHILECGQIFSYNQTEYGFQVLSKDKQAKVTETKQGFSIETEDVDYFENFFDLKTDYSDIKANLEKFDILKQPIAFGGGIRILKQDLFETLISFIVSANNNIKRIKMILSNLRKEFGQDMGQYYAFPTQNDLLKVSIQDFERLGAGYRAKYLFKVVREIKEGELEEWKNLKTEDLKNKLIALSGVGPKVADCVMLFGFGRMDVFPVDTWIAQMYNKNFGKEENRNKIRQNLLKIFGNLSGYAQQYLFFSTREN